MSASRSESEFETSAEDELARLVSDARVYRRLLDQGGQSYVPNHIPLKTRIWHITLSCFLIVYGTVGVSLGGILVLGKRSSVIFHGVPMWLVFCAMLTAVANLLSVVLDHYDQRENEHHYRQWAKYTQVVGWFFFVAAFVLDIFVFRVGTWAR